MQGYVDRGVYAGITTLIARRGKVVHAEQFGWRDKEAQSPMTADTIFRLYSMTKPIVSAGLMTLLEEGRFTLVDPLAKYIPAFGGVKVLEADGSLVNPVRPDHAARSDDPHERPDLPLRRGYSLIKDTRAPSFSRQVFAGRGDRRSGPVSARLSAGTRWRYSVGSTSSPA